MDNQNEKDETSDWIAEFLVQNSYELNNNVRLNKFFAEDNLSISFLNPLINGFPFVPFSGSSLRPFCLNHIINDITINNRKKILEFGSGISSIFIGRLIKKNKLNASLVSIEHDLEWSKQLATMLEKEGLDDVIKIHHSPLKECSISLDGNLWYDTEILDSITKNKVFDMIIVDGPPAWKENLSRARYPALPYMIDKLSNNYAIYVDDAIRKGETEIIELWQKKFPVKFTYSGNSLAYFYGGKSFYTEPYAYY